jgi:hypothetical protein
VTVITPRFSGGISGGITVAGPELAFPSVLPVLAAAQSSMRRENRLTTTGSPPETLAMAAIASSVKISSASLEGS